MSGIWVIAENRNGEMRKVTFEILSEARKMADSFGQELNAVVLGSGISGLADILVKNGADRVFVADAPVLAHYQTEAYTDILGKLLGAASAPIIMLGHSAIGKDLAPRLAERLGCCLVNDCIQLQIEGESIVFTRPVYAGKVLKKIRCNKDTAIMNTLRPNVFVPSADIKPGKGHIVNVAVDLDQGDLKSVIRETINRVSGKVELSEADIVVAGGRGMKGPENFKILEDLAEVLGAAVGASRAAVDAGWKEQQDQVGQTGRTVSPTLYIACGISGAIQHMAGMSSSKFIVAINKDPDAGIFKVADFGIVGDLFDVVPMLTEELKKIAG